MTDLVFNFGKGQAHKMVRLDDAKFIVMLLKAAEAAATLKDRDDIAALLAAANTEAVFTNYGRKVTLVGVETVDDTNDRVDIDLPDQTWTAAGNGVNDTLVGLVVAYEEAAADATRIPLTFHDFAVTTDGSDLTAQFNVSGFIRIT